MTIGVLVAFEPHQCRQNRTFRCLATALARERALAEAVSVGTGSGTGHAKGIIELVLDVLVGLVVLARASGGPADLVGLEQLDRILFLLLEDLRLSFDVALLGRVIGGRLDLFPHHGSALFLLLNLFEHDHATEYEQQDGVGSDGDQPVWSVAEPASGIGILVVILELFLRVFFVHEYSPLRASLLVAGIARAHHRG